MDSKTALTLEKLIFGHRLVIVVLFSLLTLLLAVVAARGLRIDASFTKQLPLKHEYMQTFVKHQGEFGGANRVLIALIARDGNMFTAGVLRRAQEGHRRSAGDGRHRPQPRAVAVHAQRALHGSGRGRHRGGQRGRRRSSCRRPRRSHKVRENILKAGIRGRLVANDFSGALV